MYINWNSTGSSGNNNTVMVSLACPELVEGNHVTLRQAQGDTCFRGKGIKGFTLLEILIAVFILAIVLSTVYAAYQGTFRIIADTERESEIYGMATSTMNRMLKDLGAVAMLNGAFRFVSRPSVAAGADFAELTFISRAHLAFREDESSGALAEIAYYVEQEGEEGSYRLLRSDRLNAEAGDDGGKRRGFVICEGLSSLKFKFIDNAGKEHPAWDSVNGAEGEKNKAPAMVVLELRLANPQDKERPYVFATSVFLPGGTAVPVSP